MSNNDFVLTDYKFKSNTVNYYFHKKGLNFTGTEKVSPVGKGIKENVKMALSEISYFVDLAFTELSDGSLSDNTIGVFLSAGENYAYAYYPQQYGDPYSDYTGGDIFFSQKYASHFNQSKGSYGYSTIIHELGHALGLSHPHDNKDNVAKAAASKSISNYNNTVMTYSIIAYGKYKYEPSTLMPLDISALQQKYGASMKSVGDSKYIFDKVFAYVTGDYSIGNAKIPTLVSLFDAGGVDTIDLRTICSDLYIDLTPGVGVITEANAFKSGIVIASSADQSDSAEVKATPYGTFIGFGTSIEVLMCGSGNDSVICGADDNFILPGGGTNSVKTGAGKDLILLNNIFSSGYTSLLDFDESVDKLYLAIAADQSDADKLLWEKKYNNLSKASLNISQAAEFTSSDQFLAYNPFNGELWADLDGNEAKYQASLVAILPGLKEFTPALFAPKQPDINLKLQCKFPVNPLDASIEWNNFPFDELFLQKTLSIKKLDFNLVKWKSLSTDQYEQINWGFVPLDKLSATSYASIHWDKLLSSAGNAKELNYKTTKWNLVDFSQLTNKAYANIAWNKVNLKSFSASTYQSLDWAQIIGNPLYGTSSYRSTRWKYVDFKKFDTQTYSATDWNQVGFKQLTSSQYQSINWNKINLGALADKTYKAINWKHVNVAGFDSTSLANAKWNLMKGVTKPSVTAKVEDVQLSFLGLGPQPTGSLSISNTTPQPTSSQLLSVPLGSEQASQSDSNLYQKF